METYMELEALPERDSTHKPIQTNPNQSKKPSIFPSIFQLLPMSKILGVDASVGGSLVLGAGSYPRQGQPWLAQGVPAARRSLTPRAPGLGASVVFFKILP